MASLDCLNVLPWLKLIFCVNDNNNNNLYIQRNSLLDFLEGVVFSMLQVFDKVILYSISLCTNLLLYLHTPFFILYTSNAECNLLIICCDKNIT